MKPRRTMLTLAALSLVYSTSHDVAASEPAAQGAALCPMTEPNGNTPPWERRSTPTSFHGTDGLWTALWPNGSVVFEPGGSGFVLEDGSLQMKFPWWRGVKGRLTIEGRRLDGTAPPLRAHIPDYGETGFQATSLIFPTAGCWEVTGRVGDVSLTFVVRVVYLGNPRDPKRTRDAPIM